MTDITRKELEELAADGDTEAEKFIAGEGEPENEQAAGGDVEPDVDLDDPGTDAPPANTDPDEGTGTYPAHGDIVKVRATGDLVEVAHQAGGGNIKTTAGQRLQRTEYDVVDVG